MQEDTRKSIQAALTNIGHPASNPTDDGLYYRTNERSQLGPAEVQVPGPSSAITEEHTEHFPWCDDMKERLISEFRARECLWNPSDVSYRNLRVKKQAIAEVAAKLSSAVGSTVSESEVHRQWNMLRDQYRRAKRTGKFQWRFSTLLNFLNFAELRKGNYNYMETSMVFLPSCGMKVHDDTNSDAVTALGRYKLEAAMEATKSDSEGCREVEPTDGTVLDEAMKMAEGDRTSESQSEEKFYSITRKRPASNDQNFEGDSFRSLEQYQLVTSRNTLTKPVTEDRFTYFGRMIEAKLRMIYGESREDAVRLERKISDAIFEKELEILGKNRCFN
uniref:MADF domain-containing protein n=1 Tax=Syphacia muris TaxID=451379 RepID=A0A0N5ABC0_9BILA